jgi:hypothetical protein
MAFSIRSLISGMTFLASTIRSNVSRTAACRAQSGTVVIDSLIFPATFHKEQSVSRHLLNLQHSPYPLLFQ